MHSGRTLALFYLQAMYCFTFKFIFHVLEMTATNKHLSTLVSVYFLNKTTACMCCLIKGYVMYLTVFVN